MKTFKYKDMIGGWFIGPFTPTVFHTQDFECAFKIHLAGEKWPSHYHTVTEINLIIDGEMEVNGQIFKGGDIFIMEPKEIIHPVFLKDCKIFTIKTPYKENDKHIIFNDL